jgi:hypothetical protein
VISPWKTAELLAPQHHQHPQARPLHPANHCHLRNWAWLMEQTAFGHWNLESTIDLGGKIIMFLQDLDWLSWELRKHTKFPNIGLQSFKTMVSHRCSELNLSQLAQVQYRRGPKWGRWICSCYHFRSKQAFNFGRVRWLLQELVNVRIEWGYIVYIYQPLVLTTQSCTQIKTAVSTIPPNLMVGFEPSRNKKKNVRPVNCFT